MKFIPLIICITLFSSGCTTATNYTEAEKIANQGHPPKMLFGMLKVYPENGMKILMTPMTLAPTCSPHRSSTTYINTTTTIRHSNGTSTTYSTKGTIR